MNTKPKYIGKMKEILFDHLPKPLKFENELREAANNLLVGALKSSEYAAPLLVLLFLRCASDCFKALKREVGQKSLMTNKYQTDAK